MMPTPVGLTRAEEAREQQLIGPRIVVVAAPGIVRCRASVPPNGDDCSAAASCTVIWSDGDRTVMCEECAIRTQLLVQSHHTSVCIEELR